MYVYIYLDAQFQVIVVNHYLKVSVWDETMRGFSMNSIPKGEDFSFLIQYYLQRGVGAR